MITHRSDPHELPDGPAHFSANRAVAQRGGTNWIASKLEHEDAPALGVRRVLVQASKDLFGTKDVQDIITASYVWLADQIGHLALGLILTLLACWAIQATGTQLHWDPLQTAAAMSAAAAVMFGCWVYKERQDLAETRARAGQIFPFDLSDIVWNVRTALLYLGIGGVLALGAFLNVWLFLGALVIALWPALTVAYWWLRRKLAFQQAGLPYLYRLANFNGGFEDPKQEQAVAAVSGLCDSREKPVSIWHVLTGHDPIERRPPPHRHVLLTGPLGCGKTSLAVGIGTEFAFVLGLGRYLSASELIELAAAKPGRQKEMDYNDGRVLWPWNRVGLLIVDDIDVGVALQGESGGSKLVCSLVRPADFQIAMKRASGLEQPLLWLRNQRSVWVLGDPSQEPAWRTAISELMGEDPNQFLTMRLSRPTDPLEQRVN